MCRTFLTSIFKLETINRSGSLSRFDGIRLIFILYFIFIATLFQINVAYAVSTNKVTVRMFNVDDVANFYINGNLKYTTKWGYEGTEPNWKEIGHRSGESGVIDITDDLVEGKNELRITLWNAPIPGGAVLSIEIKQNDEVIFFDNFQKVDSTEGIKYDKSVPITLNAKNKYNDVFVWPVDPKNNSKGKLGKCSDWPNSDNGCFWISGSDVEVDQYNYWRDVQPFQLHKCNKAECGVEGFHLGADYNIGSGECDFGKFVYPASSGKVIDIKNGNQWGNVIFLEHNISSGKKYVSMYAHVELINIKKDDLVSVDRPIARIGKVCWVDAGEKKCWSPHLHFEIRDANVGICKDKILNLGKAYSPEILEIGEQCQIDPNKFISNHLKQ